jgi:CubicO group peptidase (beta-lactamase class C family)
MQIDRRALLASTIALALPTVARAQDAAGIERPYWPTARWKRDEPEDQGIDPGLLSEADAYIEANMPDVTGFVVVRGGYVVHELYRGERYGRNDPVRVRSVTKSVTGALIGIALGEGHLESLDQTLGELIPERIPAGSDPLNQTVTVRHLLTMTGGWAGNIGNEYQRLIGSDNWVEYTLSQPFAYLPGEFYAYNSGGSHLLSVILAEVTGQDTADYAQEKLFDPLGIKRPKWQRSPQDEAVGGFGLELSPRNMAKIGYLHLNNGVWDGEQIIPADYVAAATSYQSAGDATGYAAYGFQWWVIESDPLRSYFALGFGSQYIYVAPERDLVVVFVKGCDDPPPFVSISRPVIESYVVAGAAAR